ncbi:CPBP family intramembrane metalloprotease [Sphingobacteriales bacterium CHB3]|nr:CPBP family intramembrane metalloprotease [Sphingobacteriales bacterium CHB3]
MIPASFTLIGGITYGWLRFNSGSLLYPIVAHSAGNLAFQLTAFVGA